MKALIHLLRHKRGWQNLWKMKLYKSRVLIVKMSCRRCRHSHRFPRISSWLKVCRDLACHRRLASIMSTHWAWGDHLDCSTQVKWCPSWTCRLMGSPTPVAQDSIKCRWVPIGILICPCTKTRDNPWAIPSCNTKWLTIKVSYFTSQVVKKNLNIFISLKVYNNSDWTAMDPAILSFRQFSSFPQNQIPPHPQQQQDMFMQHLAQQQNSQSGRCYLEYIFIVH